jgi:Phosphotransferase enzyme family
VVTFGPPRDAIWHPDGADPSGINELICHNDLARCNLIVGKSEWVFIDWDLAAPGRRLWDLALAACSFVPMWPEVPVNSGRYHLFCDASGLPSERRRDLLEVIVQRTQRMWNVLISKANREPYARLVAQGHADSWRVVSYTASNPTGREIRRASRTPAFRAWSPSAAQARGGCVRQPDGRRDHDRSDNAALPRHQAGG